jgi:hypothetical protein
LGTVSRIGTDDVLVSGVFDGTLSLDAHQLTSNGSYDIFIARIESDGDVVWASVVGSAGPDDLPAAVAAGDFALVVGNVYGDTRFPDGTIVSGFGPTDGFIYQR